MIHTHTTKQHLFEIDLMRAVVIFGVLCVHVISFFNLFAKPYSVSNLWFEALLSPLHFTRETFLFITGLVLFATYYPKPLTEFSIRSFWFKRFSLIAIPYLFWNIIYIIFEKTYMHHISFLSDFLFSIATGSQFYLYFLIISIQFYIIFPFFLSFFQKIKQSEHSLLIHIIVLSVSFLIQIVLMEFNKVYLQQLQPGQIPIWIRWLYVYRDRFILTYQFWFVAGAFCFIYYQQIKQFVIRHSYALYALTLLAVAGNALHAYLDLVWFHETESNAVLVLQPMMTPYSLIVTLFLWRVGLGWSQTTARLSGDQNEKKSGKKRDLVSYLAGSSFGIFLIHPILLHFAETAVYRHTFYFFTNLNVSIKIALIVVCVYFAASAIAWLLGLVPYLSYVVGKKRKWKSV